MPAVERRCRNCFLLKFRHGAKIIGSRLGKNVFVGFNSFLRGTDEAPLTVGEGAVVIPHTIIDLVEPLAVPAGHVVWGYVTRPEDLATQSVSIEDFAKVDGGTTIGNMKSLYKMIPATIRISQRIITLLATPCLDLVTSQLLQDSPRV